MKKRDLFAELTEGFATLADTRKGKRTLRTYVVRAKPAADINAKEQRPTLRKYPRPSRPS
jgi:putative transcriptional regulator